MEIGMLQPCLASVGDAPCPDAYRDQIEQRIIRAYVRLVMADDVEGTRTVTFARLAGLEARLTEAPVPDMPDVPPFWLEIHSVATGTTLDSLGCFEFDEDELNAAVDFVWESQQRHRTSN